jgi:voltage-gated sodium channel
MHDDRGCQFPIRQTPPVSGFTNVTATTAPESGIRRRLHDFIYARRVQNFILALILVNAALLGLETWPAFMAAFGDAAILLDRAILAVFVAEIALRLFVHGGRFFRDAWSVFDFVVVAIALVPAAGPFAVLRALRVLRVLRVLTLVPSMRRVVGALLGAIPGLLSIALVLVLIYYVAAVIATNLFSAAFPDWFGDIGRSLYTLFQVMTLESWSMGISRPVMEQFPYAWAFFVPFILIATFTMLNLFIAVIVNAMNSVEMQGGEELPVVPSHDRAVPELVQEVQALRQEITAMRGLLEDRQARP